MPLRKVVQEALNSRQCSATLCNSVAPCQCIATMVHDAEAPVLEIVRRRWQRQSWRVLDEIEMHRAPSLMLPGMVRFDG